jgi:cell division septal protein FtsQ
VSAEPERVSRQQQDAADMAAAAQASAETSRFERLEQRVRRIIHGLFMVMATLWLAGLAVIMVWEFTQWHR